MTAADPSSQLEQWVIYHNTTDFPGLYVARRWFVGRGGIEPDATAYTCETLEQARDIVEQACPGAYNLGRAPDDDPTIVEVWT